MDTITPAALQDRIDSRDAVTIIDVRDPSDFETNHIDPGNGTVTNVPYRAYDNLENMVADIPDADTVYVICWSGVCSERVAQVLEKHGYDAVSVEGGMQRWREQCE